MDIVGTAVIVRNILGLGRREVALSLETYGGRSMLAVLLVPRLLDKVGNRTMIVAAASVATIGLSAMAVLFASCANMWTVVLGGGSHSASRIR